MSGEVSLGKVKLIRITRSSKTYDMSFYLENGCFHVVHIEDLPYLLIKALGTIEDYDIKKEFNYE